jgi:hypothetical protein
VPQALFAGRLLVQAVIAAQTGKAEALVEDVRGVVDGFAADSAKLSAVAPGALAGRVMVAIQGLQFGFDPVDQPGTAGAGAPSGSAIIGTLLKGIRQKGQLSLWNIPSSVDLAKAKQVKLDENQADFAQEFRRYYRHVFANRTFVREGLDLLRDYFIVGTSYPVALRFARYVALGAGRDEVTLADLCDGIGYADVPVTSRGVAMEGLLFGLQDTIMDMLSAKPETFARILWSESASTAE